LAYEVYEFEVDFTFLSAPVEPRIDDVGYQGRLRILFSDPVLDDQEYISENILVKDLHEKTVLINYFNDNNRDIFYLYGIQHLIRIPYLEIYGFINDEVEISINDLTNTINVSTVTDGNTFKFDAVTKNVMLKLSIALSSKHLFINDSGYIKKDSLGIENLTNTNLYEITAELLKTNTNFNINSQGQIGVERDYETVDVAKILDSGTGLIKV